MVLSSDLYVSLTWWWNKQSCVLTFNFDKITVNVRFIVAVVYWIVHWKSDWSYFQIPFRVVILVVEWKSSHSVVFSVNIPNRRGRCSLCHAFKIHCSTHRSIRDWLRPFDYLEWSCSRICILVYPTYMLHLPVTLAHERIINTALNPFNVLINFMDLRLYNLFPARST